MECQNVKMYKKVDNNLDKIPVLHFFQNKYMINTSDELTRKKEKKAQFEENNS